jgi:hypothetical protein
MRSSFGSVAAKVDPGAMKSRDICNGLYSDLILPQLTSCSSLTCGDCCFMIGCKHESRVRLNALLGPDFEFDKI